MTTNNGGSLNRTKKQVGELMDELKEDDPEAYELLTKYHGLLRHEIAKYRKRLNA